MHSQPRKVLIASPFLGDGTISELQLFAAFNFRFAFGDRLDTHVHVHVHVHVLITLEKDYYFPTMQKHGKGVMTTATAIDSEITTRI